MTGTLKVPVFFCRSSPLLLPKGLIRLLRSADKIFFIDTAYKHNKNNGLFVFGNKFRQRIYVYIDNILYCMYNDTYEIIRFRYLIF